MKVYIGYACYCVLDVSKVIQSKNHAHSDRSSFIYIRKPVMEKFDICDVYAIVWNHYRHVFDEMIRMMRVTRFPI